MGSFTFYLFSFTLTHTIADFRGIFLLNSCCPTTCFPLLGELENSLIRNGQHISLPSVEDFPKERLLTEGKGAYKGLPIVAYKGTISLIIEIPLAFLPMDRKRLLCMRKCKRPYYGRGGKVCIYCLQIVLCLSYLYSYLEINSVRLLLSQKKIIETLIYDFFLKKPNNF